MCQRKESGKPEYKDRQNSLVLEVGAQGEVTLAAGTMTLSSQQGTARISQPFAANTCSYTKGFNRSPHPVGLTLDRHSRTDGCKKISWEASKRFSNHQSLHHHH